jgi:hypothetical protein
MPVMPRYVDRLEPAFVMPSLVNQDLDAGRSSEKAEELAWYRRGQSDYVH